MSARTLARRMADYATSLRFEDLPGEAVHEARRRVLDSLGCALGAWGAEPCAIARRIASRISCNRGAVLWGLAHYTSPDWAAFANGCLVRYLDYNDTYLSKEPAHPSDNIPAAIAVAGAEGRSGRELIAAIVIAYEVQCRLCDAASLRAIGWDHVTYGCFSTAAAAARLMGLDAGRAAQAISIAGVASAALRQSRVGELSPWKGVAFASAARQGVFAAMLAREGMTGPAPIFEGEMGFEKLVSGPLPLKGPFGIEPDSPVEGEQGPMILRTSIKCWPVEYHAQSAVEAALVLRAEVPADDPIDQVLVESHDAAVDIIGSEVEKWAPETRETADHSLPYIVAVALADGQMTAEQFAPARLADPALRRFIQSVKVERNAELTAIYPGAVGNRLTLTLRSGRTLSRRVDYPCGHARNRMSDEGVEDKFHRLADPVVGRDRAGQIIQCVRRLDRLASVGELTDLLTVPAA